MLIVADTSPLIAFSGIDRLDILEQIFERMAVCREVADEIISGGAFWLEAVAAREALESQKWLFVWERAFPLIASHPSQLSKVDVSAISLAKHLGSTLLMDERRGRAFALSHGVEVVGSLGVLIRARRVEIVHRIKPLIEAMEAKGIRYSRTIIEQTLANVGEL